jgi:hypothetical protein
MTEPEDPLDQIMSGRDLVLAAIWIAIFLTFVCVGVFFRNNWFVDRFIVGPYGTVGMVWFAAWLFLALRIDALKDRLPGGQRQD